MARIQSLHKLFSSMFGTRSRARRARVVHGATTGKRLALEPLEDRRLLAVFNVDSFADTVDADLGDGFALDAPGNTTQRAAIMEANYVADGDLIDALLQQGIGQERILSIDSNGIPRVSGTEMEDSATATATAAGFAASSALPTTLRGWETIPNVIRADGVDSFLLEVDTNGPVTDVRMDTVSSYFIPPATVPFSLRDDGLGDDRVAGDSIYTSGLFRYNTSRTFPDHYELDDDSPEGVYTYNLGSLNVEETDSTVNRFLISPSVGMLRPDVPETTVQTFSSDVAVSPHLINVLSDSHDGQYFLRRQYGAGGDLRNLTNKMYEWVPDDYDFLLFFTTDKVEETPWTASTNFTSGIHSSVQVNYTGSRYPVFDGSGSYGSQGRLQGVNVLEVFDRGMYANNATHELVHQWSAQIDTSLGLSDSTGHYDPRSNVTSLVGGFEWIDNGDGTYTVNYDEGRGGAYHAGSLDKYMAGLIPASQVPDQMVYVDTLPYPGSLTVPIRDPEDIAVRVTIDDIIAEHGARTPDPSTSQKDFNIGFVVESQGRLLTPTEMTYYEVFAEWYTKTLPVSDPDPYIGGGGWQTITRFFGEGTTWNSQLADESLLLSIATDSIVENAGPAATTATLTRSGDLSAALTVTLASNDTTEAVVPATVDILAGQASVTFDVDAIDDGLSDNTQTAFITASATGFLPGGDAVDVLDNEPQPTRQIRGTKWRDMNGDGIRDPGDLGIEGWTVYLDANGNGQFDTGEVSTPTDVNGDYEFNDPAAGTHTVAEVQPNGWVQTFPDTAPLSPTVAASIQDSDRDGTGDSLSSSDWLLRQSATMENRAIVEFDLASAVGKPLAGVLLDLTISVNNGSGAQYREFDIFVYSGNGTAETGDFSIAGTYLDTVGYSVADHSGSFRLDVLDAVQAVLGASGTFAGIRVDPVGDDNFPSILSDSALRVVTAAGVPQVVNLGASDRTTGIDFGNWALAAEIRGTKWNDLDADGVKDAGEPGLAGWTIFLDDDADGLLDAGETSTTTDSSGHYAIGDLVPGTYTVAEVQQANWAQTAPVAGTYSVTLITKEVVTGRNFGNRSQLAEIQGTKFNDSDGDGVKDTGEPGLPGWTIYLDANGNGQYEPLVASEFTSTDVPMAIDASNSLVESDLTVPAGAGTVLDVNVTIDITHDWNSDLDVFLVGPDATRVELFTDVGTSSDDFNGTVIDDEAASSITAGSGPFSGSFQPEGTLSSYDGKSAGGTWTLEITDDYPSSDHGELLGWSLEITMPNEVAVLTDANGAYLFDDLQPGTHTVAEVQQLGWLQTAPAGGSHTVILASGEQISGRDFGNLELPKETTTLAPSADGYATDEDQNGTFTVIDTTGQTIRTQYLPSGVFANQLEDRGLFEFDLSSISALDTVVSATLQLSVSQYTVPNPTVHFFSYAGDGSVTLADATAVGVEQGQKTITQGGSVSISIDPAVVQPLIGTLTDLGIMTRQLVGDGTYVAFASSEYGLGSQPQLIIETIQNSLELSLDIAATSVAENAGPAATTVTITRTGSISSELDVILTSDDLSEATVPPTATILAGQASVTVNLDAVDDALPDGTQTVTITASATDSLPFTRDSSFGIGGLASTSLTMSWEPPDVGMAVQPDGKILAAMALPPAGSTSWRITRLNTDGSVDTGFGTNGVVDSNVSVAGYTDPMPQTIAVQADGKFLVGGWFVQGTGTRPVLARYNADGPLDTTFGTGGIADLSWVSGDAGDIAIRPDGKILVAIGSSSNLKAVQLNSDGSADTSFGSSGLVSVPGTSVSRASVLLLDDGRFYLAGSGSDGYAARLTAEGTLDPSFGTAGVATVDIGTTEFRVSDAGLDPHGRIVLGGYTWNGSTSDMAAARLTYDGVPDTSFSGDGFVSTDFFGLEDLAVSVVVQVDGKVVLGGLAEATAGNHDVALLRYDADGQLDTSFDGDGRYTDTYTTTGKERIQAIAAQEDGKLLALGGWRSGNWRIGRYTGLAQVVAQASDTLDVTDDEPDINLKGNSQDIADGDLSPELADHTHFGTADVDGGLVTRTFTIENTGGSTLTLTAPSPVSLSGTHVSDFTIIAQPAQLSLAVGASTTFEVQFDPSASLLRQAVVEVASDDPDENPHEFAIQGTGMNATGSITGLKWNDADGNGIKDPAEVGQGGVTIYLDLNLDGSLSTGEPTVTTQSDGTYTFPNVDPGTYIVAEDSTREQTYPGTVAQGLERATLDSSGVELATGGGVWALNEDGQYAVIVSNAANLVPGDTNSAWDLFVRDRLTGAIDRVSVDSGGVEANGGSGLASISADGRYVAFESDATNLVSGDTNGVMDIFVHDRGLGTTVRVSVNSTGTEATAESSFPQISADGKFVVFQSAASELVTGDTNNSTDAFVHELATGQTTRASVDSGGTQGDGGSTEPSISGDGRFVAFQSGATNLVSDDTNNHLDVFVHDRQTGATERVSFAHDGTELAWPSMYPMISANGQLVVFSSGAADVVPGDTNGFTDAFVYDRATGTNDRVSLADDEAQGDGGSFMPSISADGRFVAFFSTSNNLVPVDTTTNYWDVFVRDRVNETTIRMNVADDGTEPDYTNIGFDPILSGDGRYVGFSTSASNLVPGDTNATYDGFINSTAAAIDGTHSVIVGPGETVPDVNFGNRSNLDFGDAPDTAAGTSAGNYNTLAADNGPSHKIVADLYMGAVVDGDDGILQNAAANADDNSGTPDDEDGLTNPAVDLSLIVAIAPSVDVNVTNNTGAAATLYGWIDYDNNGLFENATERASVVVPDGTTAGIVTLNFPTVPVGSAASTYARFRFSTDTSAAQDPIGPASDGEVEDYTVTIDDSPPTVTLSVDSANIAENGGVATFTVLLSNPTAQPVTVDLGFSGTATLTDDYTRSATQIVIPALSTSGTVTVTGVGDAIFEGDETVILDITGVTNGTESGTQQATTTITDDDPLPTLSIDDVTVGESGATATFTVTLDGPSGQDVGFDFATTDGTATAGADYAATSGSGLISAGSLSTTITVTILEDTLDEIDETFTVDLSTPVNATIADATGLGTITDDDPLPTLSIDDVTVGESGATATFTVTLDGPSGQDVGFDFATTDGTATAGADYAATSGSGLISAGSLSTTITVTILEDTLDEIDETFTVDLSTPVNATIADATGLGTITDDDPLPTLSIDDVTVGESGATATFTVTLDGPSGQDVGFDFATTDDTATAGADYAATSGSGLISAGSLSTTITVTILEDTLDEIDETFTVDLSTPVNATIADATGLGTITDDDPLPTLSIDDVTVGESGATATFTVTLDGPSGQDVGFDFATTDDTATAGADYAATSGSGLISAGSLSTTITVTILEDTLDEIDETFTVDLSTPVNATIADATGLGTITDDDPLPTLSIDDVTVGESGATATFTVTLDGPSGQDVGFDFATTDDTATAGADYAATSGSGLISAGSLSTTITVTILEDTLDEIDETFTVDLSTPVNATIADATGLGTITDDDPLPTLSIDDVTVGESGATATFTVTLDGPSGQDVGFDFATTDDTATAGADYAATSGSGLISAGSLSTTITVTILEDTLDEIDETFTVDLSTPVNATIADATGLGTITDDDPLPTLSIDDVTVGESGATATFTVTLDGPSGQDVGFDFATTDDTATAGADYAATSGSGLISAGSLSTTITVTILEDTLDEIDETFTVDLSTPVNATIADATGLGTITDDDPLPTLSIDDITVGESGATATFTVTLDGPSGQDVGFDFATTDDTATAGADYAATSGSGLISAGSLSTTITVTILEDTLDEIDETFTVDLSTPVNATIADATGLGTITDDDPLPTLSIDDVTVGESGATATFTVTLDGPSGQDVGFDFATTDDTATAGADYAATSGSGLISAGSLSTTITVTILEDTLDEIDETFTVDLSTPVNATIADATGLGTITDDDPLPTLSIDDITVGESGATATFTVTLDGPSGQDVGFDFATTDGTATAGADYAATSGSGLISAGSLSTTITVTILEDTLDEIDETFTVDLSTPVNATIADATGLGTITDNDGLPTLSIDDITVGESGATATFTVTLDGPSGQDVGFDFATTDGTATAGADYAATSGSGLISAGSLSTTITVTILEDTLDEIDETFTVDLSTPVNATIADATGLGTITDNDVATVAFQSAASAITDEVSALHNVTLVLTTSPGTTLAAALTVDVTSSDGTATSGSDYTALNSTVTFAAGSGNGSVQTVSLGIVSDVQVEGEETLNLTLSSPLSPLGLGSPTVHQVTISDNDLGAINMCLVRQPTPIAPGTGEVDVLPASESWVHEWESFWVELWVSTAGNRGVSSCTVDLAYVTDYATAASIEWGVAFTGNRTGTIADGSGLVDEVGGQTSLSDVGDDRFALLARVEFVPTSGDQAPVDEVGHFAGPYDLGLALRDAQVELVNIGQATCDIGPAPATELWPVIYDFDDSDLIDFTDFDEFATAFGQPVGGPEKPYTWWADFDKSNLVDFADFDYLASNIGRGKPDNEISFPSTYPGSWVTQAATAGSSGESAAVFEEVLLQVEQPAPADDIISDEIDQAAAPSQSLVEIPGSEHQFADDWDDGDSRLESTDNSIDDLAPDLIGQPDVSPPAPAAAVDALFGEEDLQLDLAWQHKLSSRRTASDNEATLSQSLVQIPASQRHFADPWDQDVGMPEIGTAAGRVDFGHARAEVKAGVWNHGDSRIESTNDAIDDLAPGLISRPNVSPPAPAAAVFALFGEEDLRLDRKLSSRPTASDNDDTLEGNVVDEFLAPYKRHR